jgi:hypothetical protein
MIGEGAFGGAQQSFSNGLSFLVYTPTAQNQAPSIGPKTPMTYGVTESFNVLSPGQSTMSGLSLTGAALFADPTTAGSAGADKQAIDQSLSYNHGGAKFTVGFMNIGKQFAAGSTTAGALDPSIAQDLTGKKGQEGFNTGFDFNKNGTKIGLQFNSIADSLQNQHRMSETMSLEREFNKALSLSFQRSVNDTNQLQNSSGSHVTTNVMHLAYSPTRSGFLLDGTNTETQADNGASANDFVLKIAKQFSKINLSSQFESADNTSGGVGSGWSSQSFNASGAIRPGLTFTGYWATKSVQNGVGTDDFDVTIKSAETRYLQLAAEYSKSSPTAGASSSKQSLVATIAPGSMGPLGPLLLTLSINNQQNPCLDGYENYTASISGQIAPRSGFDVGLTGAKYYLAYSDGSVGGATSGTGNRQFHSARTLRLVSAPTGKNGLSWTVSQQQRLDQNGQPMRTSSDYEAKYVLDKKVSLAANSTFEAARPDGSFSDQDSQGVSVNYNEARTKSLILQYVHSRCASQNISAEDGYFVTYSGTSPSSTKLDFGLGEQTKYDQNGNNSIGTTADLGYDWKADDSNLVHLSSKLTDWQNHGYNNLTDSNVEATGQINFQRLF